MYKVFFNVICMLAVVQTSAQLGATERYGKRTFDPELYKIQYATQQRERIRKEYDALQQIHRNTSQNNKTQIQNSQPTRGTSYVSKSAELLKLAVYLYNNFDYTNTVKNLESSKYWTGTAEGEVLTELRIGAMAAYHFASLYNMGKLDRIIELYNSNSGLAKYIHELSTIVHELSGSLRVTAASFLIAAYYETGRYDEGVVVAEKIQDISSWLTHGQQLHTGIVSDRNKKIFLQLGFCYYQVNNYLNASVLLGLLERYLKSGLSRDEEVNRQHYLPAYIHSLTETFNAQKAVELFGEIDETKIDPAWKFTIMSKALLYNGSYAECEKLIGQFESDPKHSYLASLRSIDCMLYKKEYEKALQLSLSLYKKDSLNIDVIIRKSIAELTNKIDLDEAFLQSVKKNSSQHSLNTSITALLALQKLKKQSPEKIWNDTWGPEIKRRNAPLSEPLDFYSMGTLLQALGKTSEAKIFLGYAVRNNFPAIPGNENSTQTIINPDALISTSLNSIEEAIRQNDTLAFRKFIALGHANQLSKTNLPVLSVACQVADIWFVKKLLENGANPNAKIVQGGYELPVYFYLNYGYFIKNKGECKSEILQLLVNAGMRSDPQIAGRYLQMNRQEIMDEKMEKYKNNVYSACDKKIEKILLGTVK